ncbi:MAG TPA: hypothetical protein VF626_01345 [Chthoniobacterales bacterium]
MAMTGHINYFRVARVNLYVVNKELGAIEIKEHTPLLPAVTRNINLAVERAEI